MGAELVNECHSPRCVKDGRCHLGARHRWLTAAKPTRAGKGQKHEHINNEQCHQRSKRRPPGEAQHGKNHAEAKAKMEQLRQDHLLCSDSRCINVGEEVNDLSSPHEQCNRSANDEQCREQRDPFPWPRNAWLVLAFCRQLIEPPPEQHRSSQVHQNDISTLQAS